MTQAEWVICERSSRWAAAVRTALKRACGAKPSAPRVFEVRQLGEVTERLKIQPNCLVLVEVNRANLGTVLAWLADGGRRHPGARFAALIDGSLVPAAGSGPDDMRQQLLGVLYEAGAGDVIDSPRRLHGLLELGSRHAQRLSMRRSAPTADMSPVDWAWSMLPWQGE